MVLHIVLAALLLAVPAGVLYLLDRKMLISFCVATARMVVQVMVLCVVSDEIRQMVDEHPLGDGYDIICCIRRGA